LGLNREVDYFDRAQKTVLVNLLLDKPIVKGQPLFYVYNTEPGFATYRVVNYPAFCPDAIGNNGYPLTVELFLPEDQTHHLDAVSNRAVDELKKMGLVAEQTETNFSAVEVLPSGFPLPSMTNIGLTTCRRDRVNAQGLKNLSTIGILSEDNLFFQSDVIKDTYKKICALNVSSAQSIQPVTASAEPTDSGYTPSWAY
jgi:hypothetical protein